MSKATIEQAVTGLIPTLSGPLPPDLIELALSLLARSRNVAHSLKSEEEIARPYACAQLACERLKKRLNLPAITPRPPCPPRIYKKLYKYLESVLLEPKSTSAPSTPRKANPRASASAPTTPKTPKTPKSPASGRKLQRTSQKEDQGPPEWIMPAIRSLLAAFEYPLAAGHVYTGVEVVLPFLTRTSERSDSDILALVAVILFYVLSRMMDQEISPAQFMAWREKAVTTLLKSPAAKDVSRTNMEAMIDELMPMAQEQGWLRMEWFMNVLPPSVGEDMQGVELEGGHQVVDAARSSGRGLQAGTSDYIGLGTMMQDATDYLGERQREDYQRWKADILARVQEMEAS